MSSARLGEKASLAHFEMEKRRSSTSSDNTMVANSASAGMTEDIQDAKNSTAIMQRTAEADTAISVESASRKRKRTGNAPAASAPREKKAKTSGNKTAKQRSSKTTSSSKASTPRGSKRSAKKSPANQTSLGEQVDREQSRPIESTAVADPRASGELNEDAEEPLPPSIGDAIAVAGNGVHAVNDPLPSTINLLDNNGSDTSSLTQFSDDELQDASQPGIVAVGLAAAAASVLQNLPKSASAQAAAPATEQTEVTSIDSHESVDLRSQTSAGSITTPQKSTLVQLPTPDSGDELQTAIEEQSPSLDRGFRRARKPPKKHVGMVDLPSEEQLGIEDPIAFEEPDGLAIEVKRPKKPRGKAGAQAKAAQKTLLKAKATGKPTLSKAKPTVKRTSSASKPATARKSLNVGKASVSRALKGGKSKQVAEPKTFVVKLPVKVEEPQPGPIDPDLLSLSREMTRRLPVQEKPEPQGQPLVWADSRQALCETVPYFKKPQGGCHSNDKQVYAFLFDGVGHCREYMDTDVIIARAGGGMESDATGQMVQRKHQNMDDAQVQGVLNNKALQNPLIVICGDKNTGSLTKMPHKYCVLGWYKVIDVWAEKTAGKGQKAWTTIKYRLERLNSDPNAAAWYAPSEVPTFPNQEKAGTLERRRCKACGQEFPKVYLCGWICLSADCVNFWELDGMRDAPCGALDYNPAFLLDRSSWQDESEPYSVKISPPEVGKVIGDHLRYINTRGVCCPDCGRCNSRYLFKGWRCDTPGCDWALYPQATAIMPATLHAPWETTGDGPGLARNKHAGNVDVDVRYLFGYKVYTYRFEGINGSLVHAVANNKINREKKGPNDMLVELQTEDMGLERRRFGQQSAPGLKQEKPTEVTQPQIAADVAPSLPTPDSNANTVPKEDLTQPPPSSEDAPTLPKEDLPQSPPLSEDASVVLEDALSQPLPPSEDASTVPMEDLPQPPLLSEDMPMVPKEDLPQPTPLSEDLPMLPKEDPPSADNIEGVQGDGMATKKHDIEEGDFMTAFSMNYGMPYKFIASGASRGFEEAPDAVRACRSRLNWAARTFLADSGSGEEAEFNEELIFAYMEGQKIEYHDDGEEGLGPRIATLSLGGKAKMHLRMKAKHYVGCSKTGVFTPEEPKPGGIGGKEMDKKRHSAWEELQQLKDTDRAAYRTRSTAIPKELGIFDKRTKKADDLVTITLSHGDIVLMEGYEIQKYLEHKVVPEDHLRFALTCRVVLENHLTGDELPAYYVGPDDYGYDGSKVQDW